MTQNSAFVCMPCFVEKPLAQLAIKVANVLRVMQPQNCSGTGRPHTSTFDNKGLPSCGALDWAIKLPTIQENHFV